MDLKSRVVQAVQGLVDDTGYDASVKVASEGLTVTDPHGRGADLELGLASNSRMSIKVGTWSLLEIESDDIEGVVADVKDILSKVMEGGLQEHVWRRKGKIIAANLQGVGHVVSRSTLTPRRFGSREVIEYSSYRRVR